MERCVCACVCLCVCVCVCSRTRTWLLSHVQLFVTLWTAARQALFIPGKNTGVGWHFLHQGIFPTQGSNPCFLHLLHWQADSLPMCHLGTPCLPLAEPNWKPKIRVIWSIQVNLQSEMGHRGPGRTHGGHPVLSALLRTARWSSFVL